MKKGINIWSFPQGTIKQSLSLAKDAGFEGVELALNGEGELSMQSTEKEIKEVKKIADDLGLSLYSLSCGLCWDYRLSDDDKAVREKAKDMIKKQLDTAKVLGADTILVIPGVVNVEFSMPEKKVAYDVVYERALEGLNELKGYAEQLKVNIGLENVWNKFLLSPMEMRDFIDKVGSEYVGSYLDIGNTLYCSYPEDWVRVLATSNTVEINIMRSFLKEQYDPDVTYLDRWEAYDRTTHLMLILNAIIILKLKNMR